MKSIFRLFLCAIVVTQASCSIAPKESKEYRNFSERKNYVKSYKVYVDDELLEKAKQGNTSAKVNLDQQRIRLLVDGRTALDSPVTTGKRKFRTPTGSFKIIDKLAEKESNLYGTFYKDGARIFTGSEKEYAEKHNGEKLEFDDYKGATLDNWMRLTRDGVGIHQSRGIYRTPRSHGCVRVPVETSRVLFSKLYAGSTVDVVQNGETSVVASKVTTKKKLSSKKSGKKDYMNKRLSASERLRLLRESKKSGSS